MNRKVETTLWALALCLPVALVVSCRPERPIRPQPPPVTQPTPAPPVEPTPEPVEPPGAPAVCAPKPIEHDGGFGCPKDGWRCPRAGEKGAEVDYVRDPANAKRCIPVQPPPPPRPTPTPPPKATPTPTPEPVTCKIDGQSVVDGECECEPGYEVKHGKCRKTHDGHHCDKHGRKGHRRCKGKR